MVGSVGGRLWLPHARKFGLSEGRIGSSLHFVNHLPSLFQLRGGGVLHVLKVYQGGPLPPKLSGVLVQSQSATCVTACCRVVGGRRTAVRGRKHWSGGQEGDRLVLVDGVD